MKSTRWKWHWLLIFLVHTPLLAEEAPVAWQRRQVGQARSVVDPWLEESEKHRLEEHLAGMDGPGQIRYMKNFQDLLTLRESLGDELFDRGMKDLLKCPSDGLARDLVNQMTVAARFNRSWTYPGLGDSLTRRFDQARDWSTRAKLAEYQKTTRMVDFQSSVAGMLLVAVASSVAYVLMVAKFTNDVFIRSHEKGILLMAPVVMVASAYLFYKSTGLQNRWTLERAGEAIEKETGNSSALGIPTLEPSRGRRSRGALTLQGETHQSAIEEARRALEGTRGEDLLGRTAPLRPPEIDDDLPVTDR